MKTKLYNPETDDFQEVVADNPIPVWRIIEGLKKIALWLLIFGFSAWLWVEILIGLIEQL